MNVNKLKPYNIEYEFSSNEIENQVTFFNALEYRSIILKKKKN